MPQCECSTKKETWKTSYSLLSDEIRTANPTMSDHDVRVAAKESFFPRYQLDKKSIIQEQNGVVSYESIGFKISSSGEIYYPEYGNITINQLNERTKKYNPLEYNEAQHKASLLLQETIGNGASYAATAYIRSDGNRDINIFFYDKETNSGKLVMKNTGPDGSLHSYDEMRMVMKDLFPQAVEMYPEYGVSVFSDKPMSSEIVHEILQKVSNNPYMNEYKAPVYRLKDSFEATQTMLYVGVQTKREIGITIDGVKKYFERKKEKKNNTIIHQPVLEFHRERKEHKKNLQEIYSEKPGHLWVQMKKKRYKEKILDVQHFFHTEKKLLNRKEKKSMKHTEQKIQRYISNFLKEGKGERAEKKQKKRTKKMMETDHHIQKANEIVQTKKTTRGQEHTKKSIDMQRKETRQVSYRRFVIEMKKVEYKIRKVREHVTRIICHENTKNYDTKKSNEGGKRKNNEAIKMLKKREAIYRFIQTLGMYSLCRSQMENTLRKQRRIEDGTKQASDNKYTPDSKLQETPWVLFSILFYLAMIREQGAVRSTNAKHVGFKIKRAKKRKQGIIFSYMKQSNQTTGVLVL